MTDMVGENTPGDVVPFEAAGEAVATPSVDVGSIVGDNSPGDVVPFEAAGEAVATPSVGVGNIVGDNSPGDVVPFEAAGEAVATPSVGFSCRVGAMELPFDAPEDEGSVKIGSRIKNEGIIFMFTSACLHVITVRTSSNVVGSFRCYRRGCCTTNSRDFISF